MVLLLTCEVSRALFHLGGNDFQRSHAADTTPISQHTAQIEEILVDLS